MILKLRFQLLILSWKHSKFSSELCVPGVHAGRGQGLLHPHAPALLHNMHQPPGQDSFAFWTAAEHSRTNVSPHNGGAQSWPEAGVNAPLACFCFPERLVIGYEFALQSRSLQGFEPS